MITVHWVEKEPNQTDWEYEFYALSTDPKPDDPKIAVNSLLCELDTGNFYYLKSKSTTSTTRETIIEEQSFTGNERYISEYLTYVYQPESDFFSNENVIVVFDGVRYECTRINEGEPSEGPNFYGANYDNETGFDWSEFPFSVVTSTLGETPVEVYVTNSNEHTIEVYTESTVTTPAVWEKVGGGSSSANNLVGSAVVGTA